MVNRIHIEIKPVWISAEPAMFRYQVYQGHRWSIENPSTEDIDRIVWSLRGVGTVTPRLNVYPRSIEVVPFASAGNYVGRVHEIVAQVFGE